jgi:serine/threonine protein kinase
MECARSKQLDHPGVIRTLRENGYSRRYLVMEWVSGRPLRQILAQQNTLPAERTLRITLGILNALDYIHSRKVRAR